MAFFSREPTKRSWCEPFRKAAINDLFFEQLKSRRSLLLPFIFLFYFYKKCYLQIPIRQAGFELTTTTKRIDTLEHNGVNNFYWNWCHFGRNHSKRFYLAAGKKYLGLNLCFCVLIHISPRESYACSSSFIYFPSTPQDFLASYD